MIIDLDAIGPDGLDVSGAVCQEVIGGTEADPVRCVSSVVCKLHCQIVDQTFLADGTLTVALKMRCRRCDGGFPGCLEGLGYHYDQELDPMPESVDLTEDIRESILLAFPSYPVCCESCKGLCAQCGVNLNEETCGCAPPADVRWGTLDRLGLGKE